MGQHESMARPAEVQSILNELGPLIHEQRLNARVSGPVAAFRAGFSQSKLSKIEHGKLWPEEEDVRRLVSVARMAPETTERVDELLRRLRTFSAFKPKRKPRIPLEQRDLDARRDLDELGRLVRQHRENANLSRAATASRAGLSETQLVDVEQSTVPLSDEGMCRLAEVLRMTPHTTVHALTLVRRLTEARDRLRAEGRRTRRAPRRRPG
ncbi:transcriptional regulator [Lentzea sp. NPDC102401]|uniref:transcriptional regulator n=1 Tax=Lentzea sp. NPDC102401 TaxID=3364128 RepID=UPI003822ACCD